MKVTMVTGPSSGIGRVVAIELGKLGFHVVAAGRSAERTRMVITEIQGGGGSAEYLALDLASLESARNAARTFEANHRQLDLLVNNAGVGAVKGLTTDGFEIHFGVNHLGHFMLARHLKRSFRPGTRIVQVSSEVHHRATVLDMTKL